MIAVTILWRGLNSAECRSQIAGVSKWVEQAARRGCRSLLCIVQACQRHVTWSAAAGDQSPRLVVAPDLAEALASEIQPPTDPAVTHGSSKDPKLFLDCVQLLDITLSEDG